MKLRLHGTRTECDHVARQLATVLRVVSVSDPYRYRGRSVLVRVYLIDHSGDPAEPDDVTADLGHEVPELPDSRSWPGRWAAMGDAWTGAALLAGEAAAGLGLALLGALLTRVWHRRRHAHRSAGSPPATEQATGQSVRLAGQAWTAAWHAHGRLAQLEDRVTALEQPAAEHDVDHATGHRER